mmetsp:Transcript_4727/g.9495  ORF Transcript_4727/g.9495 Transcript_4727/m.9495 type:complete len:84 (+) Transcript_4727:1838-2089(+)
MCSTERARKGETVKLTSIRASPSLMLGFMRASTRVYLFFLSPAFCVFNSSEGLKQADSLRSDRQMRTQTIGFHVVLFSLMKAV